MSPVKEPRFLTRNVSEVAPGVKVPRGPEKYGHKRGIAWYESLFEGGADLPARGEASPQYIGAVDGPELMEHYVPGVKVIFALRQPVDRAYSHYWWHRKRGMHFPEFSAALDDHQELRYMMWMSHYAQHLERYRQALGPDRVHLILFDDLRSDPARVYRELCRFIGVDDSFAPPSFSDQYNPYAPPRITWLQRGIWESRHKSFGRLVPSAVLPGLRKVRQALYRWNAGRGTYPPLDAALRERLTERFAPDIEYVERLTRPLPEWWPASVSARGTARPGRRRSDVPAPRARVPARW